MTGRKSIVARIQEVLLLMVCAFERGYISSGKYFADQNKALRAWRRGGFQGLTTCLWVWSGELIYLCLSHHSLGAIIHRVSETEFIFWGLVPPVMLSYLLYMDWQGSRSLALSRYEDLSEDMKNVWYLLGLSNLVIPMCLFLVLFFWSLLPMA
jgi:hypothetical protein